ncbi:MAG: hypothetical protein F6K17_17060, partial [Okeania sp. SIO3C4]|nr:hypothetical protein [Okeania sp. SIO3C4]
VAGHSLGGTISPLLGLSLYDCQSEWDKDNKATIKVVSVAGMSPGNEAFAEYYQSKLGDRTERIWCDKDIVPYMSTVNGLSTIPTLYAPKISNNILVSALFNTMQLVTQQHKYTPISQTPGYSGSFEPSKLSQKINENEFLKAYLITECSTLIYLIWLQKLENIPFMPSVVEDKFEELAEEFSKLFAEVITKMLGVGAIVDQELENIFDYLVNSVSTIPVVGALKQFNRNLLSTASLFGLIDYYLQFSYQHTQQYVNYFGFSEFDLLRLQITAKINEGCEEENARKQKPNTVVVEYGKAKDDDIKDLLNGEGKLLNNISDVVVGLKLSGTVEQNVQPLLFIIEKEKEKDRGFCG